MNKYNQEFKPSKTDTAELEMPRPLQFPFELFLSLAN